MMDRWPLLGAVCAFCVSGAWTPAFAAEPQTPEMLRAQREADGPKRRILEAAKAKEKAAAKAADAVPPRGKAAAEVASAAAVSKPPAPAAKTPPLAVAAAPGAEPPARATLVLPGAAVTLPLPTLDAALASPQSAITPEPAPRAEPAQQPAFSASPVTAMAAQRLAAEDAYVLDLNRLVDGLKRYPTSREARTLRPQGTVRLWLEVDRSGQLLQVGVADSSGAPLLDGEALRSVRVGRYAPFPAGTFEGEASRRFQVAIEYRNDGG